MRNVRNILILCLAIVSMACAQKTEAIKTDLGLKYGGDIMVKDVMSYESLNKSLQGKDEITGVQVKGKVEGVCQAKGCWMNIVSETDPNMEPMFVKFKDYGFFMPKDIAGRTVIMQGKAFKEETSVDELRHYAEDDGKSKEEIEAITEPKVELKFMADAVILTPDGGSE